MELDSLENLTLAIKPAGNVQSVLRITPMSVAFPFILETFLTQNP